MQRSAELNLYGLRQYFISIKDSDKNKKLLELLRSLEFNQAIIFANSNERATILNGFLLSQSFSSIVSHSDLSLEERFVFRTLNPL